MPAAVVAVEPGSGRVLAANRAARELSGEDPVGRPAAAWLPVERCRDADGRPLAEEQLPAVRAARGERIRGAAVACDTPLGERTLRVSAETVDGVALVTCEDVTELRAAQLGERLVGDDLRSIIEGIADAVTAQGPDGSLVYANDAAVRVLGFPSAEALLSAPMSEIMARWELLTPTGEPQSLMALPGRQALMGEEPEPMLVQFRERGGEETRWSRIKARPVRDLDGSVRLAINVIEDVTELKQVEQAQRFLAEASRVLADSLDYEATLATIAKLAVPSVADWCGVDLATDRPLEAQRVAVEHVDPAKVALAQELADRYPAEARSDRGLHQVLTHRRVPAVAAHPRRADRRGGPGRGAPADDPGARHGLGDDRPDARARPRAGRDLVRQRRVGQDVQPRRPAARRGPRAPRRDGGRERPPVPRALDDRPDAAGLAAAADAARGPRRRRRRALPGGGRGPRGRRRLLRPVRDERGPLVRGHRRRLRQGRRGRGGDRAGALHDPRGGGAAALPRRDPALGQRGDGEREARRASAPSRSPTSTAPTGRPRSRWRSAAIRRRS